VKGKQRRKEGDIFRHKRTKATSTTRNTMKESYWKLRAY